MKEMDGFFCLVQSGASKMDSLECKFCMYLLRLVKTRDYDTLNLQILHRWCSPSLLSIILNISSKNVDAVQEPESKGSFVSSFYQQHTGTKMSHIQSFVVFSNIERAALSPSTTLCLS